LANACAGIASACEALETPVTGGNVSLYNETLDAEGTPQAIYPTPVIGMVGKVEDVTKVCGQGWQNEGDLIYLLGENRATLGGSEYLAVVHDLVAGKPPVVDFNLERSVQTACRGGIQQGWVNSAHDCAEGGLAVALAECCISGQRGAKVQLENGELRWDEVLFGEAASRILVSIPPEKQGEWETYLQAQLGNAWTKLGQVQEETLEIMTGEKSPVLVAKIEALVEPWEGAIPRRL
ncbi:MAG: phosphoribosylformylglycinamidine synthase II, partial [Kamptonema sp. SIO4C4]|nr:phosphoribosylformylglycinamidine synthase II [Kamptonema sp. SIO4C4]